MIDEATAQAERAGASQVSSLRKGARAKLEALRAELARAASAREATGRAPALRASQIDVLALAKPATQAASAWAIAWTEKSSGPSAERWSGGFEKTALASLPFGRARDGAMIWTRVADAKGEPAFALLFEADIAGGAEESAASTLPESTASGAASAPRRTTVAAIFSGDPLEALAVGERDGSESAYLVDDRGFVAEPYK